MDDADRAQLQQERELARHINAARGVVLPGSPGECIECGEYSPRLVRLMCARCRDQLDGLRQERL